MIQFYFLIRFVLYDKFNLFLLHLEDLPKELDNEIPNTLLQYPLLKSIQIPDGGVLLALVKLILKTYDLLNLAGKHTIRSLR